MANHDNKLDRLLDRILERLEALKKNPASSPIVESFETSDEPFSADDLRFVDDTDIAPYDAVNPDWFTQGGSECDICGGRVVRDRCTNCMFDWDD